MAKSDFIQLQSPQIAVVEASAGSGKTYALAKRYLQLLFSKENYSPSDLRTILAITFTNKATYQMKERILEFLKNIALDSFPSHSEKKDIVDSLGAGYDFAQKKAHLLIEEIIRNYSFFQVKTIDSFINCLLLGCALHIRRSASFLIKRNYQEHLHYALDLLIDQSLTDSGLRQELNDFLRHYLFVENRGGWFPKGQILELMASLFELANRYGQSFYQYPVSTESILKEKSLLYEKIKKLAKNLAPGLNKRSRESIFSFVRSQGSYFDTTTLPNSFANAQPPLNKGKTANQEFFKSWQKIHKKIKELVEREAEAAYNPYIGLFNRLGSVFESFLEKEDILFLNQLNFQARSLFDSQGITVAEVYYRLATRLKHYLIDEFQDTSRLQWDNLKLMVEDGLASGGTLFYVGDKKQAIYRFRGGSSRLFDQIKNDFSHYQPTTLLLSKNWRSQKEIVEFNNNLFSRGNLNRFLEQSKVSRELTDERDLTEITGNFSDSAQSYRKTNKYGYVFIEKIDESGQNGCVEVIREKLIKLLRGLEERFSLGDIALLARDNREVELLTAWLIEEGLPPESEKTLNVLEHPRIKELISFLRFLYSPVDDLSFALFILGSFFQKKSGLSEKKVKDFLFDLRRKKRKEEASLYRVFAAAFPQAWEELIAPFFKTAGLLSVYQLLSAIYQHYQLLKNFPDSQAFFQKFLQLCQDSQEEKPGLWGFLSCIEEPEPDKLYIEVTAGNSVKILTIHKAKGLEFPVVIVPFLRMDISAETGTRGAHFYPEKKDDSHISLLRITKEQKKYSSRLRAVYQENFKRTCIDELNNIYVALTRPKNELYAFLPKKSGRSINQALFLFQEEKVERGTKNKYPAFFYQPLLKKVTAFPPGENWAASLKEEFGQIPSRQAREGVIFHRALSLLGDLSGKKIDQAASRVANQIKKDFSLKNTAYYREKIRKIITAKNLKDIFFQPLASVYCEFELVDRRGDTKRIDRLIVFKDRVVVVDYKSTRFSFEEVNKQLRVYRRAVADIYPDRKVETVAVYLDRLDKEYF